jgi:hypothetical protein
MHRSLRWLGLVSLKAKAQQIQQLPAHYRFATMEAAEIQVFQSKNNPVYDRCTVNPAERPFYPFLPFLESATYRFYRVWKRTTPAASTKSLVISNLRHTDAGFFARVFLIP